MEVMKLRTFATNIFKISEEPWISHVRWSAIKEAITNLVTTLSSFYDYLDKRVRVASQHQSVVPMPSPSVAQAFVHLNRSNSEWYKSLNNAVQQSEEIFLK